MNNNVYKNLFDSHISEKHIKHFIDNNGNLNTEIYNNFDTKSDLYGFSLLEYWLYHYNKYSDLDNKSKIFSNLYYLLKYGANPNNINEKNHNNLTFLNNEINDISFNPMANIYKYTNQCLLYLIFESDFNIIELFLSFGLEIPNQYLYKLFDYKPILKLNYKDKELYNLYKNLNDYEFSTNYKNFNYKFEKNEIPILIYMCNKLIIKYLIKNKNIYQNTNDMLFNFYNHNLSKLNMYL